MLAIEAKIIFDGRQIIKNGVILVRDGKIEAVGQHINIPGDAQYIDARHGMVTPGFIDAHTHLGIMQEGINWREADINEATQPVTAHVRVIDAINPADRGFKDAVAGGVTTAQVLPGSSNVICGVAAVVKTDGATVEEMLLRGNSGLKIALGENPKREHGENKKLPSTRMGTAALLRQHLVKAAEYFAKKETGELKERDLALEEISRVFSGEMPIRAHAHRADDIITALRVAKEFAVDITIEHCTEGSRVAKELKAAGVSTAVGPTLSSRSKYELTDLGWHTANELTAEGVPVCLITDHPVIPIGYLSLCGAIAVREGLGYLDALKALTSNAAAHLGVGDRVGSILPQMDADLVIWNDQDPFYYRAKPEVVLINGKKIV